VDKPTTVQLRAATTDRTISKVVTLTSSKVYSLTFGSSSVTGGGTTDATLFLKQAAPTGGAVVRMKSSDPGAAQVPESITIPEGESEAHFTVMTSAVSSTIKVRITASYGGGWPAFLTVTP
jgi:hypothetical protein